MCSARNHFILGPQSGARKRLDEEGVFKKFCKDVQFQTVETENNWSEAEKQISEAVSVSKTRQHFPVQNEGQMFHVTVNDGATSDFSGLLLKQQNFFDAHQKLKRKNVLCKRRI